MSNSTPDLSQSDPSTSSVRDDSSPPNILSTSNAANKGNDGAREHFTLGLHGISVPPTNLAPMIASKATPSQRPVLASQIHATQIMGSWLHQNQPGLLTWMMEEGYHPEIGGLPNCPAPQVTNGPANLSPPPKPTVRKHRNIAERLKHRNVQLTQEKNEANQELRSSHARIEELKYLLVTQERHQLRQGSHTTTGGAEQSYATSPSFERSTERFAARPYEPALVVTSPTANISPIYSSAPPHTPTKTHSPPDPHQPQQRVAKRHHRTATPEQRQIRALTNGAPIYTLGIDPQTDRSLLSDFFEQIKYWASLYTVHFRSLNAEQIHNLSTHSTIADLGQPSQLAVLVTERDMLIAMVSAVISRFIFSRTMDEHAMYLSGHADAELCEHLVDEWSRLRAEDHEQKDDLLAVQSRIYANIKNDPDHNRWRMRCAEDFAKLLLYRLHGLLGTNLSPATVEERTHTLQELFVKGFRIGFRLHMAPVKWTFYWPCVGQEFHPGIMVNESRFLYGNVVATMREVMRQPRDHKVRFSVSPTVVRSDYSVGSERSELVHSALVQITRKGWL